MGCRAGALFFRALRSPNFTAVLRLAGIWKRFSDQEVLRGIDLEVVRGECFALLGPSGCGKTTLLRLIAGLERPDLGRIWLDGGDITELPPQRRPVGMVFQDYALFPHLNVLENVGFGLAARGLARSAQHAHAMRILRRLGLERELSKPVSALSGGQQQRVALARALVLEPRLMLFDEPLSNLDAALREQARTELKRLQRESGLTAIYVTHDQQEALALADRVGILWQGRLEQVGTPQEVYRQPETEFVARFLGANVLPEAPWVEAWGLRSEPGHRWAVRPEDWDVSPDPAGWPVLARQFFGLYVELLVQAEAEPLRVWVPADFPEALAVRIRPRRPVRVRATG